MDENIFKIQTKIFRIVGLYRDNLIRRPRLLLIYNIAMFSSLISSGLVEGYFIVQNYEDVLASADAVSTLCTTIITLVKVLSFFAYKEQFYVLMDEIKRLAVEAPARYFLKLGKVNQTDQLLTTFYLVSCMFVMLQNFSPALSDLVRFLQGGEVLREMPWKASYPYDVTLSPAYEISYFNFIAVTFFIIFVVVSFFGVLI
jgi:hypothetical protein